MHNWKHTDSEGTMGGVLHLALFLSVVAAVGHLIASMADLSNHSARISAIVFHPLETSNSYMAGISFTNGTNASLLPAADPASRGSGAPHPALQSGSSEASSPGRPIGG